MYVLPVYTFRAYSDKEQIDSTDEPLTIHLILPPTSGPHHASSSSAPQASALPSNPSRPASRPSPVTSDHTNHPQEPRVEPLNPFRAGHASQPAYGNAAQPTRTSPLGSGHTDPPPTAGFRPINSLSAGQTVQPNPELPQQRIAGQAQAPQLQHIVNPQQGHLQFTHQHAQAGFQPGLPNFIQPPNAAGMPNQFHFHHVHPNMNHPHTPATGASSPALPLPSMHPNAQNPQAFRHMHNGQNQLGAMAQVPFLNANVHRPSSAPPHGIGNSSTVIREHIGPNGQRWQSVTQSGTVHINHSPMRQAAAMNASNPVNTQPPQSNTSPMSGTSITENGIPSNRVDSQQTPNVLQPQMWFTTQSSPQSAAHVLASLQNHLSTMEATMNAGSIPMEPAFEASSNLLRALAVHVAPDQYHLLMQRYLALSNRAAVMRAAGDVYLRQFAQQVNHVQGGAQNPEASSIHVLSSPSGPQALLVSPSGYHATAWPFPLSSLGQPNGIATVPLAVAQMGQGALNPLANAPHNAINAIQLAQVQPAPNHQVNADGVHQAQDLQQAQQVQANQVRDMIRIIIPLGGHLWLLIRLFGFVYFFTHGASWRRTILLSLGALLLFIAQTGVFRPIIQYVWDPIRRHAEALLPLAGNEPPGQRHPPRDGEANALHGSDRLQNPTPQQAAERLLRERQQQDGNIIRQGLRRIERAVALFIASLVPGVGERHIAAREAAEAARQMEEREQAERLSREEEERRQAGEAVGDGSSERPPESRPNGSENQAAVQEAQA